MWIHFDLLCDGGTQRRLHRIFRKEIEGWQKRGFVKGAILTYHFHTPSIPTDSLYLCLDIPAVKTPNKRTIGLSTEVASQIPSEIMTKVKRFCNENQTRANIDDYEFNMITNESGKSYRNAPVEEILRFASAGTKIAFEFLDASEDIEATWSGRQKELANSIMSRLRNELGDNYFWLPEAFHFVCNPMLLNEAYLLRIAFL